MLSFTMTWDLKLTEHSQIGFSHSKHPSKHSAPHGQSKVFFTFKHDCEIKKNTHDQCMWLQFSDNLKYSQNHSNHSWWCMLKSVRCTPLYKLGRVQNPWRKISVMWLRSNGTYGQLGSTFSSACWEKVRSNKMKTKTLILNIRSFDSFFFY